ncbi:MAG: N-acetylmuramoyl-L-alanine amidase [Bacteroidota bacterium]
MISKLPFYILSLIVLFTFERCGKEDSSLSGKVIVIDPGHGGTAATDSYRVGPGGEREEWIDLRVGLLLRDLLEEKGGKVLMTRTEDVIVPLADRSKLAVDNKADLFVSIHHNATADSSVNFPIIYFHGVASQNIAGVEFARTLGNKLGEYMYDEDSPVSIVSDFTIFSTAGTSVLRGSYGIPGVVAEASFFTNPEEEQRLKQQSYNKVEAIAYTEAIEDFFSRHVPDILPKDTTSFPKKFRTLQEAERMSPTAKRWSQDFEEALALMNQEDTASIHQAYELFTRSARSFPDSYLAGACHQFRVELLRKMGRTDEAEDAEKRVREFYPGFIND